MDNDEFEKQVLSFVQPDRPFKASAHYDPDGDCIEFFATADDYTSERIDGLVTVYRSRDTGEIIGSVIKGVKKLLRENMAVRIVVRDGKVNLEHFILACAGGLKPEKQQTIIYGKLLEIVHNSGVEAELELAESA